MALQWLNPYLPSPRQVHLAFSNFFNRAHEKGSRKRFRVVLCWLSNDFGGRSMNALQGALASLDWIELLPSARVMEGAMPGAGRQAKRRKIAGLFSRWQADMVVFGAVQASGTPELQLLTRYGEDSTQIYNPDVPASGEALAKKIRRLTISTAHGAARALVAEGSDEKRKVLLRQLIDEVDTFCGSKVLNPNTSSGRQRATLDLVRGIVLTMRGRDGKAERAETAECLRRAIGHFNEAHLVFTKARTPGEWSAIQNNRGVVFALQDAFGIDDNKIWQQPAKDFKLRNAVKTFNSALDDVTRQTAPRDWAATQCNLGNVLLTLGQWLDKPEDLREAAVAFRAALDESACAERAAVEEKLVSIEETLERTERQGDPKTPAVIEPDRPKRSLAGDMLELRALP